MDTIKNLARCPRCGSTELQLYEVYEEHAESDYCQHVIVDGAVIPGSEFNFSPGGLVRSGFKCGECDHEWRSRRRVGTRIG